jgi:hypothetical protein
MLLLLAFIIEQHYHSYLCTAGRITKWAESMTLPLDLLEDLDDYLILLLIPATPSRPKPRSSMVVGSGTAV